MHCFMCGTEMYIQRCLASHCHVPRMCPARSPCGITVQSRPTHLSCGPHSTCRVSHHVVPGSEQSRHRQVHTCVRVCLYVNVCTCVYVSRTLVLGE